MEKMIISGVACDKDTARIAVMGIPDKPGNAFRLFSLLANNGINVDIILQSIGHDDVRDISFTIKRGQLDAAMKILEENQERLHFTSFSGKSDLAKVSVVGAGMTSTPGVAAKLFDALASAQVNIRMISTSEIKISVLIDEEDATRAVRAVHDKFFN